MITPVCDKCAAQSRGVFSCLSERQLARLADSRVPHAYQPGQRIYYQGNPSLAVFCIQRGRIKLSRLANNGEEHVIGTREAGDLMGYRAVLIGSNYRVSAEPLETSVACAIPRETFLELLEANPALMSALLVRLARDSIASEEQMMARGLDPVRARFARYLVQQIPVELRASREPVLVPLALRREEIARLIDTTPETLSRTLHLLAERGILDPNRNHIRVLDVAALERLARLGRPSEPLARGPG